MNFLITLFLIISCGRHDMPKKKDLNDSDGDQIRNSDEGKGWQRFIAKISPLEEVEAQLDFTTGSGVLVKHQFMLSNKLDLRSYIKDLMVKNLASMKRSEYFSEFSYLRLKRSVLMPDLAPSLTWVSLKFPSLKTEPKALFYITENEKVEIGTWNRVMNFQLSTDKLALLLSGEAFLAVTKMTDKAEFFEQTQEESIREKTYRVLVSDGQTTAIHYISKELNLSQIMSYLKISTYRNINEENILTTTLKSDIPEWWLRTINDRDIVIIHENLRNLSDHYLQGFDTTSYIIKRINGKLQGSIDIRKHPQAKLLFKFRAYQRSVTFSEILKKTEQRGGGQNSDYWACLNHYRVPGEVMHREANGEDLYLNTVFSHSLSPLFLAQKDETGAFWEVGIESTEELISLGLKDLPNSDYVQEGLFKSKCIGARDFNIKPNLNTSERSFELRVEALVEKI